MVKIISKPHCVYRLFATDGHLLYVGCSFAPMSRIAAHTNGRVWGEDIAAATFQWFPDQHSALRAEAEAIAEEHPEWNSHGNDVRKQERGRYDRLLDRDDPTTWVVRTKRAMRAQAGAA